MNNWEKFEVSMAQLRAAIAQVIGAVRDGQASGAFVAGDADAVAQFVNLSLETDTIREFDYDGAYGKAWRATHGTRCAKRGDK